MHELSSALDSAGIDIAALGDYQMDLLLNALHHNGVVAADTGHTAPDGHAIEASTMATTIVGGIVMPKKLLLSGFEACMVARRFGFYTTDRR